MMSTNKQRITAVGSQRRPALDLLTTLSPNAAVSTFHSPRRFPTPTPNPDSDPSRASPLGFQPPAVRRGEGVAMADDEQVERKEEVAEVRPSLPFF